MYLSKVAQHSRNRFMLHNFDAAIVTFLSKACLYQCKVWWTNRGTFHTLDNISPFDWNHTILIYLLILIIPILTLVAISIIIFISSFSGWALSCRQECKAQVFHRTLCTHAQFITAIWLLAFLGVGEENQKTQRKRKQKWREPQVLNPLTIYFRKQMFSMSFFFLVIELHQCFIISGTQLEDCCYLSWWKYILNIMQQAHIIGSTFGLIIHIPFKFKPYILPVA